MTKKLVSTRLAPGESLPVIEGFFDVTHVRNTGAAFGLMPGYRPMFIAVALGVLVGVALYLLVARPQSGLVHVALGLVCGGSVGNLVDRVVTGRVTDFLDFKVFPVFNVADSAIVVGVSVLVVWSVFAGGPGDGSDASSEV
ncbi:MAG: signal peptidase II [Coriobacteriia bacterium]